MFSEDDLWIGVLRQAVIDAQSGDNDARRWIIEIGAPICRKLELESTAYYLLKVAKDKALPFVELPKVKKTRNTIWQRHLEDVKNLLQSEPNITQSEIVRRLGIPRGRVINCVKYLREN